LETAAGDKAASRNIMTWHASDIDNMRSRFFCVLLFLTRATCQMASSSSRRCYRLVYQFYLEMSQFADPSQWYGSVRQASYR
jgi:hypothetical protein